MASSSDGRALKTFKTALDILDASEPALRDAIEGGLMDVTGPNMQQKNAVEAAVQATLAQYAAVRTPAIKAAFQHLRANLE